MQLSSPPAYTLVSPWTSDFQARLYELKIGFTSSQNQQAFAAGATERYFDFRQRIEPSGWPDEADELQFVHSRTLVGVIAGNESPCAYLRDSKKPEDSTAHQWIGELPSGYRIHVSGDRTEVNLD